MTWEKRRCMDILGQGELWRCFFIFFQCHIQVHCHKYSASKQKKSST
jgi:hypothetical protein